MELYRIEEQHPECYFRYQHAMGLYLFHRERLNDAKEIWKKILAEPLITGNIHDIDAAKRWYTKCLIKCADELNLTLPIDLVVEVRWLLAEAKRHSFERAIIDYTLMLVKIYAQSRQHNKSKELLCDPEISELIEKTNDILYKVKYYLWRACYCNSQKEREQNIECMKILIEANGLSQLIENEILTVENVFGMHF